MRRIRLVIADRRPIVLQGFESLFAAERDFEIVASCITGGGCLDAVRTLAPDVALVEDGFSDVPASGMLAAVGAEDLPTRLVFYTASVARGDLAAAVAAGTCTAIPMREEPESLLQSLRLVAPTADRAAPRKPDSGTLGENGLTELTDQERKIIRLVASGMSNKEIARQLKTTASAIEARIDHITAQLGVKNRTELARFTLSRLYGGVGALAALIWALLEDIRPASATEVDAADADTVTVMTADGTGAVVTIKIAPQAANAASGKTARAVRAENSPADMPARASRLIESRADIAHSTITVPTLTPSRAGLSSAGTFMMTAVGVSLLSSHAQASTAWGNPSDGFAWADANAPRELAALDSPDRPDLIGFDKVPWLDPDIHHDAFAFEAIRGDAMARGDEPRIIDAAAHEDGVGASGNPHTGSGAIDALTDNGGIEPGAATGAKNAEDSTTQTAAIDAVDHGQSQRDLHVSDEGAAAGNPQAEHEPPGQGSDHGQSQASENTAAGGNKHTELGPAEDASAHGQSQRDLHVSDQGAAAGKPHAEHEPPGRSSNQGQSQASENGAASGKKHTELASAEDDSTPGQSQRDLHASDNGVAAGKPHAEHEPPGHGSNQGQSQASENGAAAGNKHTELALTGDDSPPGQSQRDLHAADNGAAAGKPNAEHEPPGHGSDQGQSQASENAAAAGNKHTELALAGDDSTPGQSQRDLHASDNGAAAGKPNAEHEPPDHGSDQGQSQASENAAAAGNKHTELALAGDDSTPGQSQRDLHAADNGAAAGKPNAEHEPPGHGSDQGQSQASENAAAAGNKHTELAPAGDDSTPGQSQRDLHASDEGAAAGNDQAKQDSAGLDSNPGQVHRASDDGSAAEQRVSDDVSGSDASSGQAQRDLHQAHSNASDDLQAEPSQKAGGNDQANHDPGPAQAADVPASGDSFHFKNDMAAAKDSDHLENAYAADTAEHGLPRAGHAELALIPDADLVGPSHAEQSAADHARGVGHHPTHDLFV
ncbi:LuxR C-terminal-related transcriptional regulator [Bradyrhizobium sp. DOA9]|uniref:LuxR C-terminal-related transcriptional regulator n=1 Tax=Bradyrhizobium sp. DOA9 TaxID=1126627 RepID=UPI00072384A6|nr:LuxR C-terminal-related transcriptional regulator [Bradyrhizobium sp. DOA9]GAJ31393.1 probable transcriptional regulatory protein sgaR [Bradyrhizobium sp. DOA9]